MVIIVCDKHGTRTPPSGLSFLICLQAIFSCDTFYDSKNIVRSDWFLASNYRNLQQLTHQENQSIDEVPACNVPSPTIKEKNNRKIDENDIEAANKQQNSKKY